MNDVESQNTATTSTIKKTIEGALDGLKGDCTEGMQGGECYIS